MVFHQTANSRKSRGDENWDPEWVDYRFTAWAACGHASCKQMVAILGHGGLEPIMTQDGWDWEDRFVPEIWNPMPEIFEIPPKCPDEVRTELEAAFGLFAFQRAACATRLRVALEFLMDHVGIPRKRKNSQGKYSEQSLHARLANYAQLFPNIGAQLMALKWLGNAGSHDSEVSRNDLLDALEVFEHALLEIIEKRSIRVAGLAKQLTKKFGK